MKRMIALFFGGLLWASVSHAVSRIGGGALWNDGEGFATRLPLKFQSGDIFSNDGVRLRGPLLVTPNGRFAQPQLIDLYMLGTSFPDLSQVDSRADFDQYFGTRGWQRLTSSEACIEEFKKSNSTATTFVMGWGLGHGVVLVGADTPDILQGLQELVGSLRLEPGACGWK